MEKVILECKNLTKNYKLESALNNINLSITSGKIVGLLGPNGSGKTTLIKLANDLLKPTSGEILINGEKPGVNSKKIISYLPDKNYFSDGHTVNQLLKLFSDFYEDFNEEKARAMIDGLTIDPKKKFRFLSKGMKEKVQLLLVMSREAELYLLDEPIAGVDPVAREYILNTVINNYNKNGTVIISTHLIRDVERILDEVIFINKGNILLHDNVEKIKLEHNKSIDEYFREVYR
ncbi:MAG: ABC transporter ATP-binding protein [Leptotrichiaceae bacterium]|nr:ABC transporter ATP-binding protein [Leptotrichiaceae bacterium]